jgi:hypothetical protein
MNYTRRPVSSVTPHLVTLLHYKRRCPRPRESSTTTFPAPILPSSRTSHHAIRPSPSSAIAPHRPTFSPPLKLKSGPKWIHRPLHFLPVLSRLAPAPRVIGARVSGGVPLWSGHWSTMGRDPIPIPVVHGSWTKSVDFPMGKQFLILDKSQPLCI